MKSFLWICTIVLAWPLWISAADSVDELWSKAMNHDANAAYQLGLKYYNGDEVKKDYKIAKQCFETAKQNGKDPKLPDAYILEIEQKDAPVNQPDFPTAPDQQQKDRLAIESVVAQYNAATVEVMSSLTNIVKDPIKAGLSSEMGETIGKYADKLRAIDISDCPEDFRLAFVKLYQALYDVKTYTDSTTGWRGVAKGFLKGFSGIFVAAKAVAEVPDNTDKAWEPFTKAGNEYSLVCTKYGIRIQ